MQVGASYNVLVDSSAVTLQATSTNSTANKLLIDDPRTNNNPGVQVYVTSNLNRRSSFGLPYIYVNANLGVLDDSWDDPPTAHWTICTEDGSNIPIGAAFNYFVI